MNIKGKLTVKECLDQLGYKTEQKEYKLNIRNEKELEGNRTFSAIKKVFDKYKVEYDELLRFNLVVNEKEIANKQTERFLPTCKLMPLLSRNRCFSYGTCCIR